MFIELTNNQIHKKINEWICGDKYLSARYNYYEPFIRLQDQFVLLKYNPKGFLKAFVNARKNNSKKIIESSYGITDYHKLGGYKYLIRDKTDSLEEAFKNNPPRKTDEYKNLSSVNLDYLDKIIAFLEDREKEFYFIRTPQHRLAHNDENEAFFLKTIKERYGDIEFLDFEKFQLKNIEFGDFGHLNYKGARKYSLFFDQILKKGLLDIDNKQEFINKEIAAFSTISNDSIQELYNWSKKQFKLEILAKAIKTAKPKLVNFSFSDSLSINKLYTISQNQTGTIILELNKNSFLGYLSDKAFGIHATFYEKDKNLLPDWHRSQNSTKLTMKSVPESLNVNNKNYILLPYNKESEINEFKQVYLFMINKEKYTGTIGKGLILETIKL